MIIAGIISLANAIFFSKLPMHQSIGLVSKVLELASSSVGLAMTIVFSNINMTLPITIFSVILIVEFVRTIYVTWLRIKKAIPGLG
jgi:hypothetical protein